MKLLPPCAAALLFALCPAQADIQTQNQVDSLGGINTPLRNAVRTYQAYYAAAQFTSVVTTQSITGIEFRLATNNSGVTAGGTWPAQDLTFADYTIQLSVASAALVAEGQYPNGTTAFSYGQGANLITVRSGPLVIPAGSFTNAGASPTANDYGFTIPFTIPYTFAPGDSLVLTLGLSGYTPSGAAAAFFATSATVDGQAAAISSTTSGSAANANALSTPLFVNFVTTPVPEPGGAGLLLLGALATTFARRR
ncbi:MAG: PEP-CTERM sorting domain-containing protein [Verrucomicrobiota bacterium]